MKALNKVSLIGNIGSQPEMKALPSGANVINFSLATNEPYKDKQGEWVEQTEWHRCVGFDKVADILGKYTNKGSKVYLEGKLRTRSWEENGVKKYSTEIVVKDFILLDPKSESTQQSSGPIAGSAPNAPAPAIDDEIPF